MLGSHYWAWRSSLDMDSLFKAHWPSREDTWRGMQSDDYWDYAAIVAPVETRPVTLIFCYSSMTAAPCQTGVVCTGAQPWRGVECTTVDPLGSRKGQLEPSLRGESEQECEMIKSRVTQTVYVSQINTVKTFCSLLKVTNHILLTCCFGEKSLSYNKTKRIKVQPCKSWNRMFFNLSPTYIKLWKMEELHILDHSFLLQDDTII